jgi:branched-chain amino acid transport system substrate-binding protein
VANWRNYLNQPLSQKLQQILDKLLVASSENHYGLADKVLEELRQPYTFIPSNSPKTIVSQNKKPFAKILCFTNGAVRSKITKRNFLLGAGIAVLILIYYYYYRDKTITPSIPIPFITSGCPKQTDDFISEGEEILNNSKPFDKTEGAKHFAKCNYQEALAKFKEAWQSDKLEPETLIYLNNALLKARKKQYYTIAIAVSISKNQDDSDSRAKEMLRGVAQLQTKINLGILDEGDPYIKYLGQNFGREKATNSKGIELKGKGLKVVITNDENEESKAKQRANSVSQRPEILGVVGHYASEMTLATVDIYGGKDLALISPGSTTNEVTNYPRENFFRTVFSVKQQSRYIAEFLRKKSIRKVVIFYSEGSPFSDSFYKTFKSYFETDPVNGSGSVIRLDEFDLGNDFDEKQAIQELRKKEQEIGILLVPKAVSNAQNDAIKLTKEINNRQNWIIGSWGLFSPNTLKQIDNPRPFQNFVISVPWHALTSPNQDFLMDAQNLWGTTSVNSVTALSYDATLALIKALEKENNPTRINIREHLKATDFKVDEGATGIIEFDSNGDRKNLSGEFVHIVECRTNNLGFAFVPIKYSTAKDANLPCSNSTKQ